MTKSPIRGDSLCGAHPYACRVRRKVWASAAALAGFHVVAALQLVLVVAAVLLILAGLSSAAVLRLGVPVGTATVGVMAYCTWRALRTRRPEPVGIPVTRDDAPELWSLLDEAAGAAGTRTPDRLTVVSDAAARLIERSKFLGLIGGRRDFYLGLPLLQAWSAAQLRAVVAHELAHFSPRLSRLAPVAYRGRVAVARAVPRITRRNPAGPVLRAYAGLYRRLDAPFSRAQELQADRIAAELAGPRAAAGVLLDLPALDSLHRVFHAEYLGPGWQAGHVPDDIFGGFLRVLAARADEVTLLRTREPTPPSTWDTHPPRRDRLAALEATHPTTEPPAASGPAPTSEPSATSAPAPAATPDSAPASGSATASGSTSGSAAVSGSAPDDASPAAPDRAASAASASAAAAATPASAPPSPSASTPAFPSAPASAPGSPSASPPTPPDKSEIDGKSGAPERDLVPDLPGLGRALQNVAYPPQGRVQVGWDDFFTFARTAEMRREADAALNALSRAAGTPVATASDVLDLAADGRLGKLAEAVFPDLPPDGTTQRVNELITLLLALAALHSGAARWRHSWLGTAELVAADGSHLDLGSLSALAVDPATIADARERLAGIGIDVTAEPSADTPPPRPEVVGGVVNLVVDGARTDVLIVDTGFVLVPGLPRAQNGSAKRRLARIAAGSPAELEAVSRFVAYAEIETAAQARRRNWTLTLGDGSAMTVRAALDSDELPGGWAALDSAVAFLNSARTGTGAYPIVKRRSPGEEPVVATAAKAAADAKSPAEANAK